MPTGAGVAFAHRRRDPFCFSRFLCNFSRSLCNLSRSLCKHSLFSFCSQGALLLCNNKLRGFPANPLYLIQPSPWPVNLMKKESYMPYCSSTHEYEICLTNTSRSLNSRTFVILVALCLYRIHLKSNLQLPLFSTKRSSALTSDPMMTLTTEGLALASPWPSPSTCPYSSGGLPFISPAEEKLGFCLLGLPIGHGPLCLSQPIYKSFGPDHLSPKIRQNNRIFSPLNLPTWPRYDTSTLLSSRNLLMSSYFVSMDRRLLSCLVLTSKFWSCGYESQPLLVRPYRLIMFVRYHCRDLMGNLIRAPSEDLNLLKTSYCTQSSRTFSEWHQQISDWYAKVFQEEFTHRISLTAGDNPGPLLASFPVRVSRMHDNLFFWVTVSVIENLSKFGSYNFLPRWFSLMICLLVDRSLCSYLESTSLNWLCEYLYQTLISNSPTTQSYPCSLFRTSLLHDLKGPWHPSALTKKTSALPSSYMERIFPRPFIASLWLVPASHEAKYPSLTSQNHMLIVTIPKIPELFAEVSSTHHDLVCGMLLDSLCFGVSMILSSKFVAYLSYLMYVLSLCSKTMYSLFLPFGIE